MDQSTTVGQNLGQQEEVETSIKAVEFKSHIFTAAPIKLREVEPQLLKTSSYFRVPWQ